MSRPTKLVDWESVQRDYRAGLLSLRELATAHGINHVSIKKRADKEGWIRDLAEKIQAKASEIVNTANTRLTNKANTEDEIVLIKGTEVANVRIGHRKTIARGHALCQSLLAELEDQTFDTVILAQLGELMRSPDDNGMDKLNDIYKKVISTPGRVDTAKKLVETMRSVITMEREAYSIGPTPADDDTPATGFAALLREMRRSTLPIAYEVQPDGR